MTQDEAVACTAAKSSADAGAGLIVVMTESGTTARLISKYRPKAVILAVTNSEAVALQLLTLRGVRSLVTNIENIEECFKDAIEYARKAGCEGVVPGANVVLVSEQRGGKLNHKQVKLVQVK